jgi:hypothetical protein
MGVFRRAGRLGRALGTLQRLLARWARRRLRRWNSEAKKGGSTEDKHYETRHWLLLRSMRALWCGQAVVETISLHSYAAPAASEGASRRRESRAQTGKPPCVTFRKSAGTTKTACRDGPSCIADLCTAPADVMSPCLTLAPSCIHGCHFPGFPCFRLGVD